MSQRNNNVPVKQFIALVIMTAVLVVGAKMYGQQKPTSASETRNQIVAIETKKGTIRLELYKADAPKTVENFVTLAERGYYNKLTFHRVEPGFVIQGGDPKGDGSGGESIYGPTFKDELNPLTDSYKRGYKKGVVAMANRGPDTNGSQFFIMLADNDDLPKNYTIFGQVIEGQEIVDQIAVGDVMEKVTVEQN